MPMPGMNLGMRGAVADLGLGDMLDMQVRDETEELRKKRMLAQQQSPMGLSPASRDLFGGMGGLGL